MEKYLGKKYKLKSSDNFEEYLKFIGRSLFGIPKSRTSRTRKYLAGHELSTLYALSIQAALRKYLCEYAYYYLGNTGHMKFAYENPAISQVGLFSRKLVTSLYPVCVLTRNEDGSYSLTMTTAIRKVVTTFYLDEEFVEDRPDGVKVKSVMRADGNNLIQIQIEDNGRQSKHIREFTDKLLTVTTTAEGWDGICVRIYELVE